MDNFNPGGTELNAVRVAEALVANGWSLELVSLQEDGPLRSRYERLGVPIHCLPLGSLVSVQAARQAVKLRSLLRSLRIDVLHAHDMYSNVFAVPVARMARVPLVVASRRWWRSPEARHALANRLACRAAHVVVANSEGVARLVADEDGIPRERVAVIPNFVEPEAFEPPPGPVTNAWRAELALPERALVVGCVANLLPVKDHPTLLRGFAGVPPVDERGPYLVLVGEGPDRGQLERLASDLGIAARVRFAGRRPSRPSFHHIFDVATLTSTSEGLPNSLVEAMAAGKPIVATRVGGIPDIVDGSNGLLVDPGDGGALAAALGRLLADPEARDRMGSAGRRRALSEHGQAGAIERLTSIYGRARGSRPRGGAGRRAMAS